MIKRLFKKWRKVTPAHSEKASTSYVDSDETIVIDMSAEESFAPDEVRVQFDAAPTQPEPSAQAPAAPPSGSASPDTATNADDDHTQIWTASEASPEPAGPSTAVDQYEPTVSNPPMSGAPTSSAVIDVGLTAGLLILTDGPQRGRVFAVNLGRNRIGRGPENDIILDTGDAAISKEDHLVIAADPKNRRYFLVPGDSTNLAYVDDQPLLELREIADKAVIQIGETKLMFIQLFGNYTDWT